MVALRQTLPRFAASISKKPLPISASPQNSPDLIAPIPLYRRLLRVHRKVLPVEMRLMGDEYVKAEFRRTRTATNPLHLVGFLGEWQKYLDFHEKQAVLLKGKSRADAGEEVEADEVLESLSADQLGQLYELLQATKEVWKTEDDLPDGAHVISRSNVEEAEQAGIKGLKE